MGGTLVPPRPPPLLYFCHQVSIIKENYIGEPRFPLDPLLINIFYFFERVGDKSMPRLVTSL